MGSMVNKKADNKQDTSFIIRLEDELFAKMYTPVGTLDCKAYITEEPLPFERKTEGREVNIRVGDKWAENVFDCAWFHITGEVPRAYWEDSIVYLINCGGEGLIYDKYGNPKQAITCYASEYDRSLGKPEKKVVLNRGLEENHIVDFWIDGAANDLFGIMQDESKFSLLCVAKENVNIRALYYDIWCLRYLYEYAENSSFTDKIYSVLNDLPTSDKINEQNAGLYREMLRPLLDTKNFGEDIFEYSAIGHAHLDLAWEWPIRESKRKGARTFTNQFMNIERYPEYKFGASQAQLYKWVKDCYPDVYAKVKELAKGDNWEVQGATWVEPDSNLISAESLIRQFYYGKRFFKEEFGQDMKIFWVPDSFGYSACIPQVMAQAGVPYFLTQKMSWSEVTTFPYHTFYWEGLDGSRVLAHMLPDETYNGPVRPDMMINGEKNFKERKISDKAAMLFGIGDGGAGPGFEHIERMRRLRDVRQCPKVTPRKTADFFELIDNGTAYPVHKGELYLEKHQGTYTTRAKNKKMNRKCEIMLRNYELLAAKALECNIDLPVSLSQVDEIWQEVLLYQFHDILPGSSINRVYDETSPRYDMIEDKLTAGIKTLASRLSTGKSVYNFTSYAYDKTVKSEGKFLRVALPPMGSAKLSDAKEIKTFNAKADGNTIENDRVKLTFEDGCITSFIFKDNGKELVKSGEKMGVYSVYRDNGDCWDIRPHEYADSKNDAVCNRFETCVDGPFAYAYSFFTVGNTTIKQTITLTDGSPLADIDIKLDVRQNKSMLRVAFPTSLETNEAKFNVQFGHLSRSTRDDTPGEKAQFEVSGQKFVDLSDDFYGVSLLNDCKYGYRVKNGVIDCDLVRSPKNGPGHDVDQGIHEIKLALLPHEGTLNDETYRAAYILNNPAIQVDGCGEDALGYSCDNDNFIVETVKPAADGKGFIVRVYNGSEKIRNGILAFEGMRACEIVDIQEEHISDTDGLLSLMPFQFVSIRFVR